MTILAKLRIQSRLLLLLVFSVLALVALGAFSAITIKTEADRATAFIDGEFEAARTLSDVRAAIGNARRFEKDIFLTMGDEKDTERFTGLWKAEVVHIREAIAQSVALATPSEAAMLETLLAGILFRTPRKRPLHTSERSNANNKELRPKTASV